MIKTNYHHGDLRNSLIDAAITLMAERGVARLSLREVAKTAGVSSAAPYRHFRDKTALLEAIAAVGFRRIEKENSDAAGRFPDDADEQLRAAGVAYLHFAAENPEIITLMFGSGVSLEECGEELNQAAQDAFRSLARIIENGQQSGIFKQLELRDMTLTAFSIVHGLSMMLALGPLQPERSNRSRIDELGKLATDMLLNGILEE